MPTQITVATWEIPTGNDCMFADGQPCQFLKREEYQGSPFCCLERTTQLQTTKRQTWKRTDACKLRG
jgi:hypothetical protein